MIRKLLICPYFGYVPEWMPRWEASVAALAPLGYDVLVDRNLAGFHDRARRTLDVQVPDRMFGTGKTWDYRPVLGLMYADELSGYDFWGHTDFDCVYGRVDRFVTDAFLDGLDVHSNHTEYQCGCWSLYRNTPLVNALFTQVVDWRAHLETPEPTAWVERSFSETVAAVAARGEIRKVWNQWQAFTEGDVRSLCQCEDGTLCVGDREVMMAHFRRTKEWPL